MTEQGSSCDRRFGFTLMELLIVTIVAVLVFQVVVMLVSRSGQAYDTVTRDTQTNFEMRNAMDRIGGELRGSAEAVIQIDDSDYDSDVLTYQVPVGRTSSGIIWGAGRIPGWRIKLFASNGQLMRRVVDETGQTRDEQVLANHIDDAFMGSKGFSVTEDDGLTSIELRSLVQTGGRSWRKTVRSSVVVRNDE